MTDRELLELAAKAAGYEIDFGDPVNGWYAKGFDENGDPAEWWNPLNDDGDALRLAVNLCMDMYFGDVEGTATFNAGSSLGKGKPFRYCIEPTGNDPYAATRCAIVRAAAEIGRAM